MTATKWHPRATTRHLLIGVSTVALAFLLFLPISPATPALVLACASALLLALSPSSRSKRHEGRRG